MLEVEERLLLRFDLSDDVLKLNRRQSATELKFKAKEQVTLVTLVTTKHMLTRNKRMALKLSQPVRKVKTDRKFIGHGVVDVYRLVGSVPVVEYRHRLGESRLFSQNKPITAFFGNNGRRKCKDRVFRNNPSISRHEPFLLRPTPLEPVWRIKVKILVISKSIQIVHNILPSLEVVTLKKGNVLIPALPVNRKTFTTSLSRLNVEKVQIGVLVTRHVRGKTLNIRDAHSH